jgi:hypothetical protein
MKKLLYAFWLCVLLPAAASADSYTKQEILANHKLRQQIIADFRRADIQSIATRYETGMIVKGAAEMRYAATLQELVALSLVLRNKTQYGDARAVAEYCVVYFEKRVKPSKLAPIEYASSCVSVASVCDLVLTDYTRAKLLCEQALAVDATYAAASTLRDQLQRKLQLIAETK